ncbi:Hypothetical predicted protein [Octopus vulgaris]|uniref:Uncharacterized protein n=1 Tax=Octopus vulgaris TaxID=6645 RepID=A0AA36FB19_OCTVU|nr:Hypothetical predicted protein [Octopus vulgaris]
MPNYIINTFHSNNTVIIADLYLLLPYYRTFEYNNQTYQTYINLETTRHSITVPRPIEGFPHQVFHVFPRPNYQNSRQKCQEFFFL